MAIFTLSALKNRITDRIFENHERAIDATDLQEILHDIIDSLAGVEIVDDSYLGIRAGSAELDAGSNTVTFTSPMPDAGTYIILTHLVSIDGFMIGGTLSDLTQSGFKIQVNEPATLHYHAIRST